MTQYLRKTCIPIMIICTVFFLFAVSESWAEDEIYWAGTSHYEQQFHKDSGDHNDLAYMDGVRFDGYNVWFFTLLSTHSDDYTSKLYWQASGYLGTRYGSLDIANTADLNFRFKTIVFNNVLYVFYSPVNSVDGYSLNKIYYRTGTVDHGPTGNEWSLTFSEERSIDAAGVSGAWIAFPAIMNGKLYIFYTSGVQWWYLSSEDGLEFDNISLGNTFTDTPNGPSGTTFPIPDETDGWREVLMVAFCPGGSVVKYFFFDGVSVTDLKSIEAPGLSPSSVRLWTGTVEGYANNKYAIQAYIGSPQDGTNETWSSIFHRQYIPSGPNGDQGDWSSQWGLLDDSSDDAIYCRTAYDSDPGWTLISQFLDIYGSGDLYGTLLIYFSRGTEYVKKIGGDYDLITVRNAGIDSDNLEWVEELTPQYPPDESAWSILGIIEGTPPFPINGGLPTDITAMTSSVELSTRTVDSISYTFTTNWTAGLGFAYSRQGKFAGASVFEAKLSAGVKQAQESSTTKSYTETNSLTSYHYPDYEDPARMGNLGWAIVLKPELKNNQYVLKSWDWIDMAYDGTIEELRMTVISYGDKTSIEEMQYFLDYPSHPFGGCPEGWISGPSCDTTPAILAGMEPRSLSTDIAYWENAVICHADSTCDDPSYSVAYALNAIHGTQSDKSSDTYVTEATEANTSSFNAGFSIKAQALGFSEEGSVNFSQEIKTSTSMTQSLGFWYNIPYCDNTPDNTNPCISMMDINPYILVPKDDVTGYNAPWISDDIFQYRKAKPWALSYNVVPSNTPTAANLAAKKILVRKAQGKLSLDQTDPNRDKLSANIRLAGITPDFSLNSDDWIHLMFGNHMINSNRNEVLSRQFDGKNLVIEMKGADPDSYIRVKLSVNSRKSIFDVDLYAEQINLTSLYAYPFLNRDKTDGSKTDTIPFSLYLGGKYYANAELDVHCAVNDQYDRCNMHAKKQKRNYRSAN